MGGLSGEMYKQFAITIVISIVISGFVALSLTPSLCASMLKHEHKTQGFLNYLIISLIKRQVVIHIWLKNYQIFTNFYFTFGGLIFVSYDMFKMMKKRSCSK